MRSKERRSRTPIADINVVPYIDVMLVLLVIFMITAPILTQGVTVDLPKASSETLKAGDREPIIVSVNAVGDYFLNVSENPEEVLDAHELQVKVAAELALARQRGEDIPVLVKGDQGVNYGKVVIAMSILKQSGAEKVGLLTDSTEMFQESVG